MRAASDEHLIRKLTEKVVALIQKYHGVIWGEHGKGYRCEFGPMFFGDELFHVIRQIKTYFDPYNQLNPGKIATPLTSDESLVSLEGPLRGHFDRQITPALENQFLNAVACNGNGACFDYSNMQVMCPSYKVTHDRIHSPKGRATLIREWLRQLSTSSKANEPKSMLHKLKNYWIKSNDFEQQVYTALHGCLSCKSCVSQCPLSVDIPDYKTKFLHHYYRRHFRTLRDRAVAHIETIASIQAYFPQWNNRLLHSKLIQFLLKKILKVVDLPLINTSNENRPFNNIEVTESTNNRNVIILQDSFTTYYDGDTLANIQHALKSLGFTVYLAPLFPNGKPLHVQGYLEKFKTQALRNIDFIKTLSLLNIPIIGIDPSITLSYRDEYLPFLGDINLNIQLPQEWLVNNLDILRNSKFTSKKYYLLSHCTEKTMCSVAEQQWQHIFATCGLELVPLAAGCCGMAGFYGHMQEHEHNSKALFAMSWQNYLRDNSIDTNAILATGFSCRCQVKRMQHITLKHPLEVLIPSTAIKDRS